MGIVGRTGLDSAGIISLVDLGRISLIGPFGIIGFIGPIGLAGLVWLVSFGLNGLLSSLIGLIDHNGLVGLIGHIMLVGFVIHHLAAFVKMAKTILWWLKHTASHKVAALRISTSKIVNAATAYYAASLLHVCSFVREKMCWWLALAKKKMWLWLPLLANPTTVTCYNLQNNYFLSVFNK